MTQLADNRRVVTSSIDETGTSAINNPVEVFTPDANIDGIGTIKAEGTHDSSGLYPLQFLLPSGQMLEAGPSAASSFQFNPATSNWSSVPSMTSSHYHLGNGISHTNAAVAPARQLVMVAGGHNETVPLANNEWLDGQNPAAGWKPYSQWKQPRHNANTVILPDATVLLSQDDMDYSAAAAFQHKAQVYSPPYLFKGAQPVIISAPANLTRGQSFSVATDRSGMSSAVLVAPGGTTHDNDMHQRVIKLKTQTRVNGLLATVSAASAQVPPGYHMPFVLESAGLAGMDG